MMMRWLRLRDKLPWTPSWVCQRHVKFERLARLNIDSLHRILTPEEEAEQKYKKFLASIC